MAKPLVLVNFQFGHAAEIAGIEPLNDVFEKQTLERRISQLEKVVDRKHGLNQTVPAQRERLRGGVDLQRSVQSYAETIERHSEKVAARFAFARLQPKASRS